MALSANNIFIRVDSATGKINPKSDTKKDANKESMKSSWTVNNNEADSYLKLAI